MAVHTYSFSLLEWNQCCPKIEPHRLLEILRAWRKHNSFSHVCGICEKPIEFESGFNFALCCHQFYYRDSKEVVVRSIGVRTPEFCFLLPQLHRMIHEAGIQTDQDFLVLPDPVYWQTLATLSYEKVIKFVLKLPMTRQKKQQQQQQVEIIPQPPPSLKTPVFYKQIQEAPLNYGSLESRSCGKATLIRQIAFGKRCVYSMRGMIVPDATLRPNEIRLPEGIVKKFGLRGNWVILNRMPSLQPENFVALRVPLVEDPPWRHDCFGVPLEILSSINGDFDGDEANIYMVFSRLSQAECATLLNPEWEMGSFVMGMKLQPSQDMLVAYHLFYDDIRFLPYKHRDLRKTFRVIYELFGSGVAFRAFDDMRRFYLEALENRTCFALTLEEIVWIIETIEKGGDLRKGRGCLITQILAGAKGSFEHLHQMFGRIGIQGQTPVQNSFWSGLTPSEAMAHAKASHQALSQTLKIWQPGYGHNKIMFNVQGLTVDYLGRLIDGPRRVVEQDVLDVLHHSDAMSEETFDHLLQKVLVENRFEEYNL